MLTQEREGAHGLPKTPEELRRIAAAMARRFAAVEGAPRAILGAPWAAAWRGEEATAVSSMGGAHSCDCTNFLNKRDSTENSSAAPAHVWQFAVPKCGTVSVQITEGGAVLCKI